MKSITSALTVALLLGISFTSCEEETPFYSFSETLAKDQDFISYVKADQEITNKIISKEIDFPDNFRPAIKDASKYKSLEELVDQYDDPDFIGFVTYKRLSLLKIQSISKVMDKYPEFHNMDRDELQNTFSKASEIVK